MNTQIKKIEKSIFVLLLALGFSSGAYADVIKVAVIDSGATAYVDSARSFTGLAANRDLLNHGTEIAKLIRQGNPDIQIHMLQVCEKTDGIYKPSPEAILKAIQWSIENKMDVVNLSLVTKYNREIENLINEAATSHGVVFVAAAGNRSIASHFAADQDGFIRKVSKSVKPAFPASSENVISVGAVDEEGQIASYSDKQCDLYANGQIMGQEGTSFACARITAQVVSFLQNQPHSHKELIVKHLHTL